MIGGWTVPFRIDRPTTLGEKMGIWGRGDFRRSRGVASRSGLPFQPRAETRDASDGRVRLFPCLKGRGAGIARVGGFGVRVRDLGGLLEGWGVLSARSGKRFFFEKRTGFVSCILYLRLEASFPPPRRVPPRPEHMAVSRFTELFDPADHPVSRPADNVSLAAVLEETALHSRRGSSDSGASGDGKGSGPSRARAFSGGGKLRMMSIQRRVRTG